MTRRLGLIPLCCLVALLPGCGGDSESEDAATASPPVTGPLEDKGSDLFVLRGPSAAEGGRIEIETDVVEWFSDRPRRQAGVSEAAELVQNWQEYGFDAEPPNAALAGEGTDAEVELTEPEATPAGISFAYEVLRGRVATADEAISVFVDSSEWETDMHVYVSGYWDEICPGDEQLAELRDPVIVTAPHNWSVAPPNDFDIPNGANGEQIFNAASSSGSTNFEVQYTLVCGDDDYFATVTFKGSVPDNLNSDSFSCSVTNGLGCKHSEGGGYHVTANAQLYNP